jgi:hypothetical protein
MAKKSDSNASGIPDGRDKQFGSRHSLEQKSPVEQPSTIDGKYPVRQKTPADALSEKHWIQPKEGDPTKTIRPTGQDG